MRCELQVVVAQFRQAVGRRHKFRIVMRRCSREIWPTKRSLTAPSFLTRSAIVFVAAKI